MTDLPKLEELQGIVCRAAREQLLPRFTQVERSHKADGSVITEADLAMQRHLQSALQARWPGIDFLGEEMDAAQQQRLMDEATRPLWVLDPLDGTSNFAAGLPIFSTSLALLWQGQVVLGLVYDPIRDECFTARQGAGAWLNGQPLGRHRPPGPLAKGIGLVDFKRLAPDLATRLVRDMPYSSQRSLGSVALDWCWIAAGRCHVYLHGKQKLWDYGAGWLILTETGGYSCDLGGAAVFQPSLTPRSAVAALELDLFLEWCRWLGIESA